MRQSLVATGFVGSALVGGYLATIPFGWTALACALASLVVLPLVWRKGDALPPAADAEKTTAPDLSWQSLRAALSSRLLWAAAGLIGLHYLSPGLTTSLFYRQQDVLHMTTVQQGWITALDYSAQATAAICYGLLCRTVPLRKMLMLAVGASSVCTLALYSYDSVLAAYTATPTFHFGFGMAEVALLDLVVRASPAGTEALCFALLISMRNAALFGSDAVGSWLLDHNYLAFPSLVLLSAVTTAIAVPVVSLLPKALVGQADGA